ncbi:MAG: DsbA family protein [Rhodospirillales bacterium]|nr:DsbA family protein [Rhodospirillales bacterium]MDE0382022.1 DsbA family protein [Rhodospirillales bacterium]
MLVRTLAATGLALALAFIVAAPGQAEIVCDTGSVEDGTCDPGTGKQMADSGGASAISADDLPVDAIRKIIRDYLLEHPEVLIEVQQALQARRAAQEAEQARSAIQFYRDELLSDPEAPVAGNPDGAITLVEFFDYRCGYCRRVKPTVETLLAENDDLRLVFKEFPILGPESTMAAYAALAARGQGSYEAFHWALMETDGSFDRDHILSVARSVGLDTERLARDMEDPALDALIERNAALASALGISGTPAFVVGDRLIGGALPLEHFRIAIADARQALQDGAE